MLTNRSMTPRHRDPELPYADVVVAARWLCAAFGFRERLRIGTHRIQLRVGDGSMVVVERGADDATTTGRVMVRVADVDAHHAQAVAAGAAVVGAPGEPLIPLGSGSIRRQISAAIAGRSLSPLRPT